MKGIAQIIVCASFVKNVLSVSSMVIGFPAKIKLFYSTVIDVSSFWKKEPSDASPFQKNGKRKYRYDF